MPAGHFRGGPPAHQRRTTRAALSQEVLPAYARLADFLERDYLPAARTTVGLERPAGRRGLVPLAHPRRDHHGHAARADPRAGPRARWRASAPRCSRVKEQVGFQGDLDAFFKLPRGRSAVLFHQRAGAARRVPRREAPHRRAAAEAVRGFPEGRLRDPSRSSRSARRPPRAARTRRRRPTASGPGIFYINTYNLKAQPRFGLETLSLHEAAPGHHFQIAIQQELTGPAALPPLQRLRVVRGRLGAVRGVHRQGARRVHRSVPVVRPARGRNAARHAAGGGHRACIPRAGRASRRSSTCSTIRRWPRAT